MKNKKTLKALYRLLIKFTIVGIIIFGLVYFVGTVRIYHQNNMFPSVKDGDLIVVSKVTKLTFDQVVLYKDSSGIERLGRTISVNAGDEILLEHGGVKVNSSYLLETLPYETVGDSTAIVVQENTTYILNDYREDKLDSRTLGCISKDDIIGVVVFISRQRGI